MKLTLVVGTRPNFVKAGPLLDALRAEPGFEARLVHTGQHFDEDMSAVFFEQLNMPEPDVYLNASAGGSITQIANVMQKLEKEFELNPPEKVVVFGDVNSTLAAALVANKMDLRLAHVEAGLRSFDRQMPEEHNRVVTDMLADYLFTPSPDADENLKREGIPVKRVFRVGNIMVDSLMRFLPIASELEEWKSMGLADGNYALTTIHRPANVDESLALREVLAALMEIGKEIPVVFPIHPRTQAQIEKLGLRQGLEDSGVVITPPLGYLEFMNLMSHARIVLTDSGGIQEETTVLGVPCLTVRNNTERPITISEGTNRLVGTSKKGIIAGFKKVMSQKSSTPKSPELWDGHTAKRIVGILGSHK